MEILNALGVNSTVWIHMLCFLVSYMAFSMLVIKPYMRAIKERENRTTGGEETAVRVIEEAEALHAEYDQKARAMNSEIKDVYEKARLEAMAEYDRMLAAARTEAASVADRTRREVSAAVESAKKSLSSEIPSIGAAIASKLAGKEISL